MKRKFKIMYHQIEQLKEEIKEKEQALIKEHFEHIGKMKTMQTSKERLERSKKKYNSFKQLRSAQESEIRKLEQTIAEAEQERLSQEKEYEDVISQRDILGTQLIRRNDELALLYEKVQIQQKTLQKGEIAYKECLEEIRTLQIAIASMKRELEIGKHQVTDIDDMNRKVYKLQRELLQERTKVKALSEELENPQNVHRWRKLEGSDPSQLEMVAKVKALQRRFIAKTEEAVEKDLLLGEKEKLFLELKNILAAQPGPEVAEQVAAMQSSLQTKTKQMKAMAAELNMYHAQVHEYKDDIERLTRELEQMKRRYFEPTCSESGCARGRHVSDATCSAFNWQRSCWCNQQDVCGSGGLGSSVPMRCQLMCGAWPCVSFPFFPRRHAAHAPPLPYAWLDLPGCMALGQCARQAGPHAAWRFWEEPAFRPRAAWRPSGRLASRGGHRFLSACM